MIKLDLRALAGSCVYLAYEDNRCLYIGSTKIGGGRFLSREHPVLGSLLWDETKELELYIIPCRNGQEALYKESQLIYYLKPDLNRTGSHTLKISPQVRGDSYKSIHQAWIEKEKERKKRERRVRESIKREKINAINFLKETLTPKQLAFLKSRSEDERRRRTSPFR